MACGASASVVPVLSRGRVFPAEPRPAMLLPLSFPFLALLFSSVNPARADATPEELQLIGSRRASDLAWAVDIATFDRLDGWIASQQSDGTWTDVNYTSGCDARTSPSHALAVSWRIR